jgi:hypothetical protein
MPAPKDPLAAKQWVREAMVTGRYVLSGHFQERMRERGVDLLDIYAACEHCSRVESYSGNPRNGGTSWRVFGPDSERERIIGIGVEAFLDPRSQRFVMLCTVLIEQDDRT